MFNLGISYYNGDGVDEDEILAFAWLAIAKNEGSAEAGPALQHVADGWPSARILRARMQIADILALGIDFPKDEARAFGLYKEGAEANDQVAELKVCEMLTEGKGTRKNEPEGLEWCEKAAKQRYPAAMLSMAKKYEAGGGIAQDYKKAEHWYLFAAIDEPEAPYRLAHLYENGPLKSKNELLPCAWLILAQKEKFPGLGQELDDALSKMDIKKREQAEKLASKLYDKAFERARYKQP